MRLSTSFMLNEFTKSATALRLGLANEPSAAEVTNLKALCENVLQKVRNKFNLPIQINSGYRSPALNVAMGGAPTSQHVDGKAADIEMYGVSNAALWTYIKDNLEYDQLIAEYVSKSDPKAGWVHVSFNAGKNRKQALSCVAGKYLQGLYYVD